MALGALLVAGVATLAVMWRVRAVHAEAMLRSIGAEVGSEHMDSALIRKVRADQVRLAEAEASAASSYGALESAPIAIQSLDGDGLVSYSNAMARSLFAGDDENAILRARATALAQRVGETGRVTRIEVDVHEPERRILSLTALPLADSTGLSGAVGLYVEDLSARRRFDAMRTDFVANASHELKTPLGALSLLAETLAATSDETQRERLAQRLRSESARMANVIDDVAQLAETESLSAEFERIAIIVPLGEAVSSVEATARDRDIQLVAGDLVDAVVDGSRDQLASAFRNLLMNAIAYTAIKGEGGVVTYRTLLEGNTVCVQVEDSGIGIPARYTDRVFERFFRVDRARSRESGGTGLGLSIVKNVAIAHGGAVRVESRVGEGSVFTICVPVASEVGA